MVAEGYKLSMEAPWIALSRARLLQLYSDTVFVKKRRRKKNEEERGAAGLPAVSPLAFSPLVSSLPGDHSHTLGSEQGSTEGLCRGTEVRGGFFAGTVGQNRNTFSAVL